MIGAAALAVLAVLLWPRRDVPHPAATGPTGVDPGVRQMSWHEAALRRIQGAHAVRDDGWVADLGEVVAVGLDAGLDLPRAVLAAARSPTVTRRVPVLAHRVEGATAAGESVARTLGDLAASGGVDGGRRSLSVDEAAELDVLARAWSLSERAGAAASTTTSAAATALRARRADRQRARVLAAGPRASMWLLTALPLLGPVVGLLVGVGPDRLYGSAAARGAALTGVLLTVAGWLWARRVLRRAARPATTARRSG